MKSDRTAIKDHLDSAARHYVPDATHPDAAVLKLDRWWIEKYVKGPAVLEMGCAEGIATPHLLDRCASLDIVEGAGRYCDAVRARFAGKPVRVFQSLYEDFVPDTRYDDIVMARSLDYVSDPVSVLRESTKWLKPGGRFHLVVQNAESLHRRIAVALGMMPSPEYLSDLSKSVGHRRVYTFTTLKKDVEAAGLTARVTKGFFLKPFDYGSLARLEMSLADRLIPALFEVGKQVEDSLCSQIYFLIESHSA